MKLAPLDWTILAGVLVFTLGVAAVFMRRASKGTAEFFASGRAMPWWLIGTSMVATTFSTDTPLLVTDIVRQKGVANNWVWWAFLVGGMLTVFFYARLWRRSGVLTDLEFYEIRYSGKPAALVRGFRAVYLGLFFNCFIMASVTLAAVKIGNILFGWSRAGIVGYCSVLAVALSVLSGLWGVIVTDLLLFIMAMVGGVAAAWFSLEQVGGLSNLLAQLDPQTLNLLPDFSDWKLTFTILLMPVFIQWWATWYPGAEPGGGSYIAQRMLAAKDEKNSMGATLWFQVAHYALRPWPWILVALCSLVVFPGLEDIKEAYPHADPKLLGLDSAYPAMLKFLPAGFLGVMVASLAAAYFSTIGTHLNWGASYLVHDLYRRFVSPAATERHYILVSRIATALLMAVAAGMVFFLETAKASFDVMLTIGAGTGLIYLLRWFWWRINAWSEIAAMISSFCMSVGLFVINKLHKDGSISLEIPSEVGLLMTIGFTTVVWVAATILTRPASEKTLAEFCRKVRPFGPGWARVRKQAGLAPSPDSPTLSLLGWVLGCALVYAALFGTGCFLYGQVAQGIVWVVVFAMSGIGLLWLLPKIFAGGEVRDEGRGPRDEG